jgi:hypothetical protein
LLAIQKTFACCFCAVLAIHSQGHLLLSQVWFQPDKALSAGIKPLLRGFVATPKGDVSMPFSSVVQQNLLGRRTSMAVTCW